MLVSRTKERCTIKSILFIICQHGAFNYFQPLWKKWKKDKVNFDWYVLIEKKTLKISRNDKIKFNVIDSFSDTQKAPDLIVSSTTGSEIENSFFKKAKNNSIKIIQLIDSSYNYKKRLFLTNGEKKYPEKLILLDEKSLTYAENKDKIKKNISIPIGHPGWEGIKLLKEKKLNDILFISQPISDDYKKELGYTQREVINDLLKLKNEKFINSINISYHPREKENNKNLFDRVFKDNEGLNKCGTIVGMFSSLMVNAYYSGRNVISFQPSLKNNLDFLSQRGLIKVVTTLEDLKNNIFDGCIVRPKKNPFNGSRERLDRFLQDQINFL